MLSITEYAIQTIAINDYITKTNVLFDNFNILKYYDLQNDRSNGITYRYLDII